MTVMVLSVPCSLTVRFATTFVHYKVSWICFYKYVIINLPGEYISIKGSNSEREELWL